jgi:hypothetical protein
MPLDFDADPIRLRHFTLSRIRIRLFSLKRCGSVRIRNTAYANGLFSRVNQNLKFMDEKFNLHVGGEGGGGMLQDYYVCLYMHRTLRRI